jgi:hypothetical protein
MSNVPASVGRTAVLREGLFALQVPFKTAPQPAVGEMQPRHSRVGTDTVRVGQPRYLCVPGGGRRSDPILVLDA